MEQQNIISDNVTAFNPFEGSKIERVIYTTQSQAEIWIACKIGGDDANRAYNESVTLVLNGNLNKEALIEAIVLLVKRHESLRSVFSTDGRFMTVFETVSIDPFYLDISDKSASDREDDLKVYINNEANYIFNLVKGPLFKVGLIKVSDYEHRLILTAHHIICDGWSTGIMLEELGSLYSAIVSKTPQNLPEVNHFSDYADEQYLFSKTKDYKDVEAYWLNQYKDTVPQLSLPTDFPRPELRTYKSERLDFEMNSDLITELKAKGAKVGSSFVITLMAAFEIFLYKQTGQEDLVVGLPSAGQSATGHAQLIGHCVNLLPLRSKIDVNQSLNEYLVTRKSSLFDAYDHQQLSFGELLQKLQITRDPSRVPLVPVIFNIDVGMSDQVIFTGLDYKLKSNPRAYEAFELFLNATGSGNALTLEWSYNSSLFKPDTIAQMMQDFEALIAQLIKDPNAKLSTILATDDASYVALNNTQSEYPNAPLHQLILEQTQAFSEKQAIKFNNREITYAQLQTQIHQLANSFIENGLERGMTVGVCLPRSLEMVVTLIAIMECGAIYLPLDSNFPDSRLDFMLQDSNADFLITSKDTKVLKDTDKKTLLVEDLFSTLDKHSDKAPLITVSNEAIVYILYTSGSTGKPKGVQITHKNLVNFLYSMKKEPGIESKDRLLSITTISFDIAGLELYLPLLVGATLVIANDEATKDSRLLLELIENEGITMVQATPTTWQMMLNANWENPFKIKALCGGENLPLALAKRIGGRVDELWNMYGPTETTIWSSVKQIFKEDERITIGKPIANTSIYIVNEQGMLVPTGAIGEICISGDGVAKGYLNRPELDLDRFIDNRFSNDTAKLYRTGDLGQLLENGEVLCLGRMDQQVKLRGHRIELEEIETSIDTFEGVQSSVVLVDNDILLSYIILDNSTDLSIEALKVFLADALPAYMIPQKFNVIATFPKTLNGKIDRKALLENSKRSLASEVYAEPRTENEKLIANIWRKCLNLDKIDVKSDFFEIGGHSLIAVRVMSLIEEQTGRRLPLSSLMLHSSIEELAKLLGENENKVTWNSLVPIKTSGNKTPIYIVHGAGHNILFFNSIAKHLDDDQPVYGIQAHGLNGVDKPYDKIEDMASHYVSEIIKSNPDGPYALSGYSFGGMVAFEMVRQFKALDKQVEALVLFDTYIFPHYYFKSPFKKKLASKFYLAGKYYFALADMFSSFKNFNKRLNIFGSIIRRVLSGQKVNLLEAQHSHEEDQSPYAELDKLHIKAENRYKITPQEVEVDLLITDEDVYFKHDRKNFGWKRIALNGIKKHSIPGNHGTMFDPPYDKEVGRILQSVLDSKNL